MNLSVSREEVQEILRMPFSEGVCRVLKLLYEKEIDPIDLGFYIGRKPVRLAKLGHKTYVGECWHSVSGTFSETVCTVSRLFGGEDSQTENGWRKIGISCAFLCGLLGQIPQSGGRSGVNFAAMAEDFSLLMSAWYVRSWGFPIGRILCCSREEDGLWEFFHNGAFPTDGAVPLELERLLYHVYGAEEAERFADCCRMGRAYAVEEQMQQKLLEQMQIYVIGEKRLETTISGVYGSNSYLLPTRTAGAYAGAMDHRWATGDQETILLLSQDSPAMDAGQISDALHISQETFLSYWKNR